MRTKGMVFLLASVLTLSLVITTQPHPEAVMGSSEPAADSAIRTGPADYMADSNEITTIVLDGDSITVDGGGAEVNANIVTLTAAGTYSVSGHLADGQIVVDTEDEAPVELILNGVSISSATNAPISVADAEEVVMVLAEGTDNYVTDSASYVFPNADEDEPNAAIFSKSDLTISGSGSLTVAGHYNDGIASKDGLTITGGTIMVSAVDDGIRGKDYVVIEAGSLVIDAQGDGLKSDEEEDADRGSITIEGGTLDINAGGDAITAQTNVTITDGRFTLISGGGSASQIDEDASAKGIKAAVGVTIQGGNFSISSADDAIHSNDRIAINGGSFTLASGDDAIHADATLEINGGDIHITQSYEGIESAAITINAGTIHIVSWDDGLNVAGGNDGSGMMGPGGGGRPDGRGGRPGQGETPNQGAMPGQDMFAAAGDYHLTINGGTLVINAAGDGLDINGTADMTGGIVLISGPTESMNGALDYQAGFTISGGLLIAAGSAGMAQSPGETSSQPSVLLNFNTTLPAGTLIHVQSSTGNDILTFAPEKEFQSIAFSSPELVTGDTYLIYYGGSSSGAANDGLYQDGSYSPGTEYTSLTLSGVVTRIGTMGRW